MATSAGIERPSPAVGGDGHTSPPSESPRRRWAWWAAGGALILGGLLTAAGGALRWWGPYRLAGLSSRENDDANPLHTGWTDHVHPGSGELVASGQVLVVLGLILLIFLPWRTVTARLLAWVALLSGAVGLLIRPVVWIMWWAQGRPTADFPGWSPDVPDGVFESVAVVGSLWTIGVAPLLLAAAALLSGSKETQPPLWRRTLRACAALLLTSYVVEYFAGMILFLSDSHDDPVGTHVISGMGAAVAGALLMGAAWSARGGPVPARTVMRPRPARLRWWVAAGLLLIAAGFVSGVSTLLFRPEALMATGTTPAAVPVLEAVSGVLEVAAYVALVLGPFRRGRRVTVALLTLIVAFPTVIGVTGGFSAGRPLDPSPLQGVAALIDAVVVSGASFLVLAFVFLVEQAATRPLTRAGLTAVIVASVLAIVSVVMLPRFFFGLDTPFGQEWGMTLQALVPSFTSFLVGATLAAAAAAALKRHRGADAGS